MVLLIALTVFVSAVRPLARHSDRLNRSLGLTRLSLLCEPAVDHDTPLPSPMAGAQVFAPPLAAIVPITLKTRRTSRRSVVLRRPKLPPPRNADSLLSD
jgi:hypothetical protein